jgi:hypothetical protein
LKELTSDIKMLADGPMDNAIKARILGLHLMKVVGPVVLTAAVEALRDELTPIAGLPPDRLSPPGL